MIRNTCIPKILKLKTDFKLEKKLALIKCDPKRPSVSRYLKHTVHSVHTYTTILKLFYLELYIIVVLSLSAHVLATYERDCGKETCEFSLSFLCLVLANVIVTARKA